jgi:hypothetical protein
MALAVILRASMNKNESDRIRELCALIEAEQDRHKFLILVKELNKILTATDEVKNVDLKGRGANSSRPKTE